MKRHDYLALTCALVGALGMICWGMVYRQSDRDRTRVHLEASVPLAAAGFAAGGVVGLGLRWVVSRWPRLTTPIEAVLVPALVAGIAGPLGWLARDESVDWSGESAILRAGAWGAAIGLALFAVMRARRAMRPAAERCNE